jgi:hypothetical protein
MKQSKQVWYTDLVVMWCTIKFFFKNVLNDPNEIPATLATSQIMSADNFYSSTPQNSSYPTNDKLAAWGHAGRHLLPHPRRWSSRNISMGTKWTASERTKLGSFNPTAWWVLHVTHHWTYYVKSQWQLHMRGTECCWVRKFSCASHGEW